MKNSILVQYRHHLKMGWVLWLPLVSPWVGAATEVGNGGDAVVCRDANDKIQSAELLDYYESRIAPRRFVYDTGSAQWTSDQKVEFLLDRLSELSPARAEKYRAQVKTFYEDANFLKGIRLTDVSDSNHLAVPAHCRIEQLVIQKEPKFPEDKRYTIDQDIWDALSEEGRAGTILHELIYREAMEENRHTHSISARFFNAYLASNRFAKLTDQGFMELLQRLPFKDWGVDAFPGIPLQVGRFSSGRTWTPYAATFYASGKLKSSFGKIPSRKDQNGDFLVSVGKWSYSIGDEESRMMFHFSEAGKVVGLQPHHGTLSFSGPAVEGVPGSRGMYVDARETLIQIDEKTQRAKSIRALFGMARVYAFREGAKDPYTQQPTFDREGYDLCGGSSDGKTPGGELIFDERGLVIQVIGPTYPNGC